MAIGLKLSHDIVYVVTLILLLQRIKLANGLWAQTHDNDDYSLRIAANDILFVQINTDERTFLVQFAPFDYNLDSLQCSIQISDTTLEVYTVGLGQKQIADLNPFFYFAGGVSSSNLASVNPTEGNNSFVGIWINRDPQTVQQYLSSKQPFTCNYFEIDQLQFVSSFRPQEFFVIAVEPYGKYAIGFATDFAFIYQPFSNTTLTVLPSSHVWRKNSTFDPYATDAAENFTIVAGFLRSSAKSRIRAIPTIGLLQNNNLTILSTWSYTAPNNSWQAHLTFSDTTGSNSQYTMTVKINPDDSTRVLVGMPFINTVFLFAVLNNGTVLKLINSFENDKIVGYGKSATWLTSSQIAILASINIVKHQLSYQPKIYLYNLLNDTITTSFPSAVIPNSQQPLPATINSKLIQMISTPTTLVILDTYDGVLIILPAASGYYASTDVSNSVIAATMPVVSQSVTCIGGTYKSNSGVHPCTLCPSGSRNPGNVAGISCVLCSSNSFCPLGAVYEIDRCWLSPVSQAYAYPRSPETNVFEDILLNNMLSLGTTAHCLVVSPVFWLLILTTVIVVIFFYISALSCCISPYKHNRLRRTIKNVCQRTDLVGEGEQWLGGLASLGIMLMSVTAYVFALSYLNQYPAETVGPSNFACDTSIRNAKFYSSLQSLAVPISDAERPMFDLLNEQNLTLHIALINTAASCKSLSISNTAESTIFLLLTSCYNINGTLVAEALLPSHDLEIIITINNNQLIGGIQIGLSGPGLKYGSYALKDLNFRRSFFSQSDRTLSQTAYINLILTKAINETQTLSGNGLSFEGIWYPVFKYLPDETLITETNYVMGAIDTSTTITISISETAYYIKNLQMPIAKRPEIVFRTLLFCFLCLDVCTIVAIVCKLFIAPVYHHCMTFVFHYSRQRITVENEIKSRY